MLRESTHTYIIRMMCAHLECHPGLTKAAWTKAISSSTSKFQFSISKYPILQWNSLLSRAFPPRSLPLCPSLFCYKYACHTLSFSSQPSALIFFAGILIVLYYYFLTARLSCLMFASYNSINGKNSQFFFHLLLLSRSFVHIECRRQQHTYAK